MATYSYLGSDVWVHGSAFITGSVNIATSLPSIGSYSIQNISGTITVDNRVAGSIVNWPGSLAISNFNALGSNITGSVAITTSVLGVSGTSFNTVWLGTGSVMISGTSIPTWRGTGSVTGQITIGAGSIQTYNPIGSQNIIPKNDLTLFRKEIEISSGTLLKVVSGNVGSTINIWGYEIVASAATTLQWLNGSPGSPLLGPQQFAANGGVVATVQPPYWLAQCYPGSDVWISLTAGSLGGRINYYLTG